MGLFNKKKSNDEQQNTDPIADMYSPEIPQEIDSWLSSHQVDFSKSNFFTSAKAYADGWFNVEVAAMMASTRIPLRCDSCSDDLFCNLCGKTESNYAKIMTANADGDYLGWVLVRDSALDQRLMADSYYVSFDLSIYKTFRNENYLSFESQKLAPVLVTQLEVKPYVKDVGMLYFGDAFSTLNGPDYISGIKVQSGSYSVVAWIGYNMVGDLTPMAVTVFNSELTSAFDFKATSKKDTPANIQKCINDSINGDVMARLGADLFGVAQMNMELYDLNDPVFAYVGESWIIQNLLHNDRKQFDKAVKERWEFGLEGMFALVDSLRIRGQHEIALEFLDQIENRFGAIFTENNKRMFEILKNFPPGTFGVMS